MKNLAAKIRNVSFRNTIFAGYEKSILTHMKIVILNTSERTGGAAVAARRLLHALAKAGVDVEMLVRDRATKEEAVTSLNKGAWRRGVNFFRFLWERLVIFACNHFSRRNLFQVSIANTGLRVRRKALVQEADVIHLHWINQGFLSLKEIKRLVDSGKKVVWTLHDLWPATAICHYPGGCEKYQTGCSACPMLQPNSWVDLAKRVAQEKARIDWRQVTFVGCSDWIVQEARKSLWLRNARFMTIPNPIDTRLFRPMERRKARRELGLPEDKPLVLFAAAKLSDTRKGADLLLEACSRLVKDGEKDLEFVLLGNDSAKFASQVPFPVHILAYIADEPTLAMVYAAVDLFVIPSLEDNLPNTVMEAMACGTPCVGFRTGGIPEMIDHQVNGYVAASRDTDDLARGIHWTLHHPEPEKLSAACREKVLSHYEESVVAKKYIALYRNLTRDRKWNTNRRSPSSRSPITPSAG